MPTIRAVKMPLKGSMAMAIRVSFQLMLSIITSTPIRVTTEVMIWVRHWFMLWLTVSTSLVMRLMTSPLDMVWKKFTGRRLIFSMMALRRL